MAFVGIRVAVPAWALGNQCCGSFGSPLLETVYEQSRDKRLEKRQPPICGHESACAPKPPAPAAP